MDSTVTNIHRNWSWVILSEVAKIQILGPENSISLSRRGVKMAKIELKKIILTPKKWFLSFLDSKNGFYSEKYT